jgi:dCMP deaminase
MIIGLTGKFAAGKGTVAEFLQARGFLYHSLSDVIREELSRRGTPESREHLLALGNELREADGPAALALRIRDRLLDGRHHIVDSIRNPAEVDVLRGLPGFILVGVDADPKLRFDRLRARARIGDPETFEHFTALEAKESVSDNPLAQQLHATWDRVDVVLDNSGTLADLEAAVVRLLARGDVDATTG